MWLGRAVCPSVAAETLPNGLVNLSWVLAQRGSDQQNGDWSSVLAFTKSLDFLGHNPAM